MADFQPYLFQSHYGDCRSWRLISTSLSAHVVLKYQHKTDHKLWSQDRKTVSSPKLRRGWNHPEL